MLSANQLTTLPERLGNLIGLTGLFLDRNQLTTLPDWVGNSTGLVFLDLSGNQLTTLPTALAALVAGGTELVLDGNPLADEPRWLRSS